MRQERWVDKRRVEVTLMSRRKEYKGQVGKRMGGRRAGIFEHPPGHGVGEGGAGIVPSRTGRHQGLKHVSAASSLCFQMIR